MPTNTRKREKSLSPAEKAARDAKAKTPEAHEYADMNEVPEPWRSLRGGRLNLPQVNAVIKRSYELGQWKLHDDETPYFIPDLGKARDEHVAQHDLEDGLWVPKGKA